MKITTNNREVAELIGAIHSQVDAARSIEDLVNAIQDVKRFGQPVKYNHTVHYVLASILLFLAASVGMYHYVDSGTFSNLEIALIVIPVVISIVIFGYIYSQSRSITGLSDAIYNKNLLFDNALEHVNVDAKNQAQLLEQRFYEFNRGNHSREILSLYKGVYQGQEYTFDYHYYHFHYVDRRTETSTDSKGRTRTRTVYDRYDRYGIYLPFPFVASLAIVSSLPSGLRGTRFKPASNRFNKYYKVYSDTELTAAKFLKPKVVIELEDISGQFNLINFEFNAQSDLCMSFKDRDLLSANRTYGIDSPDDFIAEIREIDILPKLHLALEHIHALMTYTDNNFERI